MLKHRSIYARAFFLLLTQTLVALLAVVIVSAASDAPAQLPAPAALAVGDPALFRDTFAPADSAPSAPLQPAVDTNLELSIVSSPWAILDSNKPETEGPRVLVVEAVITNAGSTTATLPVITLDYNEDPVNDWVLLPAGDPVRKATELAPGDAYHAYWFATYTTTESIGHVYTVTASAGNASPVSTSQNAYRPAADTVETVRALSGGSTRLLETTSDIIVGVVFTASVKWDLGTNFQGVLLSPVGNLDFDPSSYRLVATKVTFTDETDPLNPIVKDIVDDRLYFDTIPAGTTHAQGDFIFLALRPTEARICPYTAPKYQDYKYDNAYCLPGLPITGTVTLSMAKQVNASAVQQGRMLTYTIAYTNNGTKPLGDVWIWDDVDPAIGSIITPSIDPPGEPNETTEQRVAWNVGRVAPTGKAGSTGMFTFTILVNGGGQDLADQTPIVNNAFFGIDPVELPANAALTSTATSTVQAPTVTVAKSDGLDLVRAGEALTYTLRFTNSGSITATNVVVTDLLPSGVSPGGGSNQTFYPPPVPPYGGVEVIEIPVTANALVPDGSILTNVMTATYQNEAGWAYDPESASDDTTASAPFWVLTKSDDPGIVVAGTTLTYTLTYYHNGITPAQDVSITDTLPAEVTYNGIVSQPPGWDPPVFDPGPPATLGWYTPTLSVAATGTMVFTVTVHSDASGLITNQALLTSTDPTTYTMTTEDTTVNTSADLAVTKSDDPDPVIAGNHLTYTLQVSNLGPSDASGVTLTDSLPSGLSLLSATPERGSFDDVGMVWSLGVLTDSHSASLTLLVSVDSAVTHTLTNTAIVSGDQDDPVSLNNTVTETTSVDTSADLAIDKAVSPTLLPAGATLTYTLDYGNRGSSDAVSVQIIDTMSAKVTFGGMVSTTPPLADPQVDGNRLTWSLSALTADASGTIVYTATASPAAIGIISNTVVITGPTPDSNTEDNEAGAEALIGDPTRATIYGYVFEDSNGNGEWDGGELPLADVVITLNGTDTTTTDQAGLYLFIVANPGVHTVVETDPDGYFSTTTNEHHVAVELGNSYRADFGDAPNESPFAAIYGTVFEDLHNIGQWDDDEVGLEGVTITLDGVTSTTTDRYGSYSFSTAAEGVHTVVETDPEGFFSTTPNEIRVGVTLGQGYQVDFGDAPSDSPFAAIYGTVFEDADSDGQWDGDELGIEAVTVTLRGDGTTNTNLYGSYTLSTTTEGAHTVVETDPEGYMSTTDNSVPVNVLLGTGYQVDFGDISFCTCAGDEYEEDDEPELAVELTVSLTQTHDFCDDATDWTYFAAQPGFVYTITTHSWGQRADTVLHLYDIDADTGKQTLLASSDDFEGTDNYSSHIVWQAPLSAGHSYYVRTTNRSGLIGCQTGYDISMSLKEGYYVLLPLLVRNYSAPAIVELDLIESEASADPEISFSPTGIITHTCPDLHEVDDTWELAKPIGDGEIQEHSFDSNPVEWAADKDFVWFDIQARRTITFTVPVITGTWEVELMLYDPNGDPMPEVSSSTGQLVWEAKAGGRYFLAVSPPELAGIYGCADVAGYKLKAELEPRWFRYLPLIIREAGTP